MTDLGKNYADAMFAPHTLTAEDEQMLAGLLPPSLFDTAADARDEAIDRVEEHAEVEWLTLVEQVVRRMQPGDLFTTDLVWSVLADDYPDVTTHEPRALGAVMMRLARAKVICKTGTYEPSKRKECHARPIPVWERV